MAETDVTAVAETTSAPIAVTEKTVPQVPSTIKALVEALIFAAKEPLSVKQIQALYDEQELNGESRKIETLQITQIVEELNHEFEVSDKAYRIIRIAGGYQFATLQPYAEWLGKLYKEQARRKLSQSSIESLAIIAYKQPISKPEIEAIRGVNCDYVLKTLLEKELATIVGRAPTPGRPLLYGTTKEFLKHFGLNEVTDLPRPREIEEILGESQFEAERRMLEAQQGMAEDKKNDEEDFKSRLPHIPKRKPGIDESVQILPKRKQREIKIRSDEAQSQEVVPLAAQTPLEETKPMEPVEVRNDESSTIHDSSIDNISIEEMPVETTQELPSLPIEGTRVIEEFSAEVKPDDVIKADDEIQHEEISKQNVLEAAPPVIVPVIENIIEETVVEDSQQVEETFDASNEIVETPQISEAAPVADLIIPPSIEPEIIPDEQKLESVPMISEEPATIDEKHQGVDEVSAMSDVGMKEDEIVEPSDPLEIQIEPASEIITQQEEVTPALQETSQNLSESSYAEHEGEQKSFHNKTTWQTWKEKIQGFIKKLFA